MNRQIKFRFWNIAERTFLSPATCAIDGNGDLVGYDFEMQEYDRPVCLSKKCVIPQQWTGFIDTNGKEIYEGDIIKYPNNRTGKIIWSSESGGWDISFWHAYNFEFGDTFIETEVIGNIFENINLLK